MLTLVGPLHALGSSIGIVQRGIAFPHSMRRLWCHKRLCIFFVHQWGIDKEWQSKQTHAERGTQNTRRGWRKLEQHWPHGALSQTRAK